jgi:hypothetical protein
MPWTWDDQIPGHQNAIADHQQAQLFFLLKFRCEEIYLCRLI